MKLRKLFSLLVAIVMLLGMVPTASAQTFNPIGPINPITPVVCHHKWGSWKQTRKPTCTREGQETRTCSACGQTSSRKTSSWGHKFETEWTILKEPTCQKLGRKTNICKRCKADVTYNMPKVDHIFGEWYVLAEPAVGLPGVEQHDCTFGCGTFEQREIPPLSE